MPFALELSDNVDPTALATFVLALLTLIAVVIGRRALLQTQSEVDLSRREVEEAHRPVLVPVIDDTQHITLFASTPRPARPDFVGDGRLLVSIKNIGSGPALGVEAAITPRNDAGEFSEAWGNAEHKAGIVGLGVSEITPVDFRIPQLGALPSFDLRLTYSDVARKQWVTSAKYLAPDGGRYTNVSITSD